MKPSSGAFGRAFKQSASDLQTFLPFLFLGTNQPSHFQHFRIILEFGREMFQFSLCLAQISQFEPTNRGKNVMHLWWLEFVHSMEKIHE